MIVIFIDKNQLIEEHKTYILNLSKKTKNNSIINIIEFNNNINQELVNFYFDNNINYFYIDSNNIENKIFNNSMAFNLLYKIFIKFSFTFKSLLFHNINFKLSDEKIEQITNTNINILNIDNSIVLKKEIFEKVGGFDPELFNNNFGYEIIYLIEKIKKYLKINLLNPVNPETIITNTSYIKTDSYSQSIIAILLVIHDFKIFFNFIDKKEIYDHYLWNKIKSVLINLDERKDRLNNAFNECHKINLFNCERFSGIKINENNFKKYKIINNKKAWKVNNIDYLKSATGCKMSHLEILKIYKNCNEEYIMIIEDDIVFDYNTLIYLNLALLSLENIEWEILFLASNLKEIEDAERISPNLLKIKKGFTTTAQLFKRSSINKIISIIENSDIEIDNTYNDFLEHKYCVYPMCAYQKSSFSDINKKIIDYGMFHKKFQYL